MKYITARIAENEPKGVVIAASSGRLSRLYLWDTESDEFTPGQFLKGRAFVLDISPDAKYIVYRAHKFHTKAQEFLAISHPPYFSALAFFPLHFINGSHAQFVGPKTLRLRAVRRDLNDRIDGYDEIVDRIEPNCPLTIFREKQRLIQPISTTNPLRDSRHSRYIITENMTLYQSENEDGPWEEIKSFHKEEFQNIETPQWALRW